MLSSTIRRRTIASGIPMNSVFKPNFSQQGDVHIQNAKVVFIVTYPPGFPQLAQKIGRIQPNILSYFKPLSSRARLSGNGSSSRGVAIAVTRPPHVPGDVRHEAPLDARGTSHDRREPTSLAGARLWRLH
jgi:hypothetical protein